VPATPPPLIVYGPTVIACALHSCNTRTLKLIVSEPLAGMLHVIGVPAGRPVQEPPPAVVLARAVPGAGNAIDAPATAVASLLSTRSQESVVVPAL
jgi:hypothetical protein